MTNKDFIFLIILVISAVIMEFRTSSYHEVTMCLDSREEAAKCEELF